MGISNLKATVNKNGSITATWSRVSGAVNYAVNIHIPNVGYVYESPRLSASTTSIVSGTGLKEGKTYEVVLYIVYSNSKKWESVKVTIPYGFYDDVPLGVPANIIATPTTINVTLKWDAVDRATGYDVLFNGTTYSVTATSKQITGLTPKTNYTYSIRAKNKVRTGPYSASKTVRTLPQSPAVPSNIKKTVTETSATISWGAVSGAVGYDLLFNGTTYYVTGTSKTFTGLTAGKGYTFQIRAKNSDLYSSYTSVITVTTAPKAPTGISATSTGSTITVSWNKVTGATGYIIQFNNSDMHTIGTANTFTGLKSNTSYTYRICSKSPDGSGSYSAAKSIKTLPQVPAAPANITKASTEDSVTVSWGAVSGATGYDVLFNNAVYPVTATSKSFSGLLPNTSYTYQVRGKNADGAGAYSTAQTVRTTPKAPSAPKVTLSENSATISWGAVPGATSYDVLFNGKVYRVTETSKTITQLQANTGYSYQIRVNNADGSSSYSASKTVKTAPNYPAAPSATASKSSVTISWGAVSGATSYDILFNGTVYRVTGTSKTITGLTPGTSYTYSIRSNNAEGSSSYSGAKTINTIPNPPGIPANVNASATANSVTVSWSGVTGAVSYDVKLNGTVYNVTATSKTITGLLNGTSYSYSVRAVNAGGAGTYSSSRTITTIPAVPSNINAGVTWNSAEVSWNIVTGATGYDINFGNTVYSSTGNTRTITGLYANTAYSCQVRAKNSSGASAYSSAKTIRTSVKPPSPPVNISAAATTDSVTVNWSAVSGATSYDVLFHGATYRVTATSKTITGLTSGTDYSFSVRANNAGGSGAYSAERMIRTKQAQPTVPQNAAADAAADSVKVEWEAVHGAESYDVLFNGTVYNVTDTFKVFTGLSPDTDYSYSVCARNAAGTSGYSEEKTVRTLLRVPENIRAEVTKNSVLVSWDPASGATGYDINFNGIISDTVETNKLFTGLEPNTEYTYSVRAKNNYVSSAYSEEYSAVTLRAIPPIPSNVRAASTLNSVIIRWDPSEETDSYDVNFDGRIYHVSGHLEVFDLLTVEKSAEQENVRLFSGLLPNTMHSFCVRANNQYGSSEYSPLRNIKTQISKQSGLPDIKSNMTYPSGRIPHMGLDPVNALTGAFLWSCTYLEDYGKDALHFTLMYDSQREEYPKALGCKWTYAYNYLLYMDEEYAYFSTPYDKVIPFRKNTENDTFLVPDGIGSDWTMERNNDQTYAVKALDGTEYIFDSGLRLSRILQNGAEICHFTADSEGHIIHVEGRYGSTLDFTYKDGHIISAAGISGNKVTFTYINDYLATVTDSGGKVTSFTYDDAGHLLRISDDKGKTYLTNQYDIYGRIISQNTAGRGNSYASYGEESGVTVFTDELGNETVYHYDESLHVTDIKLAASGLWNEYNEKGQLIKQTDALSNSTRMEYDECGRMKRVTYPDDTNEQVFYNERNYPVRLINRDGTESLYEYDGNNNLISVLDERGNQSAYTYNAENDLISYTDKNGNRWSYRYDSGHHLEQATDPEGNSYRYSHDSLGRMVSYTSPEGKTAAYHYSAMGDLLRIVDGDGTIAFEYDRNGNKTGVIDRMGNRQRLEYNEMGQVSLATDFMGNEFTFVYDERGKLVRETDPLGYSQSYGYDALGNQTEWTDKNGNTTVSSFNAASQLTEVKDAAGNRIKYTYDTMGQVKTVTDPMNHQTSYSYDPMGRMTGSTNALGYSVSYTYDSAGNLLTKTDENGAVTEYAYDKDNRPISISSDLGTTCFTYDKLGRIIAVQDTEGNSEKVQYDGDGNITAFSDKESRKTTYVYDRTGRLSEETNPNGGKTSFAYDANGNCIKVTDAEGSEYLYEYDANGRLKKMTDPMGYGTAYEYDAVGNLTAVTDARGGRTSYEYDGNENLVREVNPLGGELLYTYDRLNRVTEIRDEDGNKSSFAYDANGNRISYTDANRNEWVYVYDALNRLIGITDQSGGCLTLDYTKTGKVEKVVDQEGAETHYRYDSMGRLTEMSDALLNRLCFTYDSLGRVLTQTDANGNTTEYTYFPSGNLLSIKEPEGNTVTYSYNALGQVQSETDALGNTTSYVYDALGRTTSITDAMGGRTSFTYTAKGEIATVTDACGNVTHYQYDGCGNLTQVTDPLGNCTAFAYDAMNNQIRECVSAEGEQACITIYHYDKKSRKVREINPLSDERAYTYDAAGNLTAILDEDGNETTVRYDLNNRPVTMRYSDGKEAAFRYNKRGELIELKDWNGAASMEYGKTGKLAKVTDHNGRTTGYVYDAAGNITGITYPDNGTVSYTYDKNNRMTKVTDNEGKSTEYAYDAAGNLLSLRQPGSSSTYTYNAKGQPVKAEYQFDDGTFMENHISYDPSGRIIGTEKLGGMPELPKNITYTYDALGRLMSCKEGQNTEAYGYDGLGNRIYKNVNGNEEAVYQYNALNQLMARTENGCSYSYGYDKRGNLTEEKVDGSLLRQYLYDATGHMCRTENLESGEKTEYGYNGLYMRVRNVQTRQDRTDGNVSRTENAGSRMRSMLTKETNYVIDYLSGANNDLMAYEEGYGAIRTIFGRGYERLSRKLTQSPETPMTARGTSLSQMGGKIYFQPDLSGSPLFAANEQGNVLRYAERNVWGSLKPRIQDSNASDIEEELRFTGYCYDPVADAHFAQARFYDAVQGRMLSKDPVKRGLNAYPYCGNDPVNYVDPTGEAGILIGGAIGGVVGGVFGFAGSAISQIGSGRKFDSQKAWGAAANGAVVGAVRGALVGSGAGIALTLASNFAAGAAGSAFEQKISKGSVSFKESMAGGLTNAVSGAIYGNNPLSSVKSAFLRGAGTGAATSALNYLFHMENGQNNVQGLSAGEMGERYGSYLYADSRNPGGRCGVRSPLNREIGYNNGRGYQYQSSRADKTQKSGFKLRDFLRETATGFVMGGLASATFYGAGKAVEVLRGGIQNVRANKGGSEIYYRTMSQGDYDYLRMTGELPSTGETFISPTKSFSSNYDGVMAQLKVNKGTTKLLTEIGVSNNTSQSVKDFGRLPQVQSGWNVNNVFFKGEGIQTNIGLGQGRGLEIFNRNLIEYVKTGGK